MRRVHAANGDYLGVAGKNPDGSWRGRVDEQFLAPNVPMQSEYNSGTYADLRLQMMAATGKDPKDKKDE